MELGAILFILAVIYYGIFDRDAEPKPSGDINRYDVLGPSE